MFITMPCLSAHALGFCTMKYSIPHAKKKQVQLSVIRECASPCSCVYIRTNMYTHICRHVYSLRDTERLMCTADICVNECTLNSVYLRPFIIIPCACRCICMYACMSAQYVLSLVTRILCRDARLCFCLRRAMKLQVTLLSHPAVYGGLCNWS